MIACKVGRDDLWWTVELEGWGRLEGLSLYAFNMFSLIQKSEVRFWANFRMGYGDIIPKL